MTKDALEKWIKELIDKDELWRFYKGKEFRHLKDDILKEQHYECEICKEPKANTVHHVQFVRKYPRLALDRYYYHNGKKYRNLIAVCPKCHAMLHPEKLMKARHKKQLESHKFMNEERW